MTWWERLKKTMEARGLSPEEVAKHANVSVTSLYGYLRGDVAQPRGDAVARLARAAHTTESALRYGGDDPPDVHDDSANEPVLQINKALEAFGRLTSDELRSTSDDKLTAFHDSCRLWLDRTAAEQKRRKERR